MKKAFTFINILYLILFCIIANSYVLIIQKPIVLAVLVPLFLFINIFAGTLFFRTSYKRLKICCHGAVLLSVFALSIIISLVFHIVLAVRTIPSDYWTFIWSAVFCILIEAVLFWNGIACVYCTSVQLGIRVRMIGLICGMIPIANLVALKNIIGIVFDEVEFEVAKEKLNLSRKGKDVCRTKYPILFVHGVFFRDSEYFNYWGRVPKELEANGATVYYGEHQSALSVEESAKELAERIKRITEKTGCRKLNIIAHSKGGLDCRYALASYDAAEYVASLTTVNTPHRGCMFADYLLENLPENVKNKIAGTYNSALKKLGDANPDFIRAVSDLTTEACARLNESTQIPEGIYCQSVGSKLNKATSGRFPLNMSYHLVRYFDGPNDGLVGEDSFSWGEKYRFVSVDGKRGISHADIIDLNRENIRGFDVREFYVELVGELKERGF